MKNFDFHNPTRIVFGADTVAKLSTLVPHDARVLILYGGASAEKTGTLAEVRTALALGQRSVQEFGGIEPNPSYETLMRAVAQVRRCAAPSWTSCWPSVAAPSSMAPSSSPPPPCTTASRGKSPSAAAVT